MGTISRRTRYYLRRLLRSVLRTNDSPRQIAGGVAVGMMVAFSPTMGLQMFLAALVATVLKCSRLPAVIVVYITNPFTAIPIYLSCYVIGVGILRPFGFTLDVEQVRRLLVRPEEWGFWELIYQKLADIFALGWNVFAPLWLGCLIVGGIGAAIAYQVSLRFVTGHRLIKAERMARRAQRRLERIRQEQAGSTGGSRFGRG